MLGLQHARRHNIGKGIARQQRRQHLVKLRDFREAAAEDNCFWIDNVDDDCQRPRQPVHINIERRLRRGIARRRGRGNVGSA
jgi:hypothetical protein